MSRFRKATGVLTATAVSLGLWAGNAGAQNLDINELGAAVALPLITGGYRPDPLLGTGGDRIFGPDSTISLLTITNARASSTVLKIDVISGDPSVPGGGGDLWRSDSFECLLTGRETVTFLAVPAPGGIGSIVYGECSTAFATDGIFALRQRRPTQTDNGIFFAAAGQPSPTFPSPAIGENVLLADAVIIDFMTGQAVSFGAISFQAEAGGNDGNKVYKFDGMEYSKFPATLATNFIAPDLQVPERINAELILFTLDGTTGAAAPPRVFFNWVAYNDDETPSDGQYVFDCFDIVSLTELGLGLSQDFLGSLSGHLSFSPASVGAGVGVTDVHDATFGNADNSRNRGVHGWIIQNVLPSAAIVLPGQPTQAPPAPGQPNTYSLLPPGPCCGTPDGVTGPAAWGRPLSQGRTGLVPDPGDQNSVLNAGP
jgi:hypothetical protein